MAQCVECQPMNQSIASLIPSQGTCLGCGPGPLQRECERQPHALMLQIEDHTVIIATLPSGASALGLLSPAFLVLLWTNTYKYITFLYLIVSTINYIHIVFAFFFIFQILFISFLDQGEGREKERQKNINVWLPLVLPTGNLSCNPGLCSDWELNRQPFGLQAGTQCTESHQPGLQLLLKSVKGIKEKNDACILSSIMPS